MGFNSGFKGLMQYRTHPTTYKTTYPDACKAHYTIPVYSRLPEDEHSVPKRVEDINN